MDQKMKLDAMPDSGADIGPAIAAACDFFMAAAGNMHPALAVAGMVSALEQIGLSRGADAAVSVAGLLDDASSNLRQAAIADGAPRIVVPS